MTEEEATCPACGGALAGGSGKCPHCGITLSEEERSDDPARATETGGEEGAMVFKDMTTIYKGEMSDVVAIRTALDTRGYRTFIRDDATQTMNPFITGGYAFSVTLMAPCDQAEEAGMEIGRILEARKSQDAGKTSSPEEKELQDLRVKAFWAFVFGFFTPAFPVVLYYGGAYLKRCAALGRRPEDLGFLWTSLVVSFLFSLFYLGLVWVLVTFSLR